MNILVLGTFLPKSYETKMPSLSAAGNQFQYNLFQAAKRNHSVKALCYIAVPNAEISEEEEKKLRTAEIYTFFPKVRGWKELIRFRQAIKELLSWADCLLCYNMVYPWFNTASLAKKKGVKSILVLADHTPACEEVGIFHKAIALIAQHNFGQYDKVVALSSGSGKYIKDKKRLCVINGCIDWDLFKDIPPPKPTDVVNIVYTGLLSRITGVDLLIEAFAQLQKPELRLIICGQGHDLDEVIQTAVKNDSRIVFKGYISKEEYIRVLSSASILVNPRNMNYQQNQNNFPSKILEYLASGRMILSTRFRGYRSYESMIYFVESDRSSMSGGILRLIELCENDVNDIYVRNRKFSESNTWDKHIEKFL